MRQQREGEKIMNLEGHTDGVNCLAVSFDDSLLVSGSEDQVKLMYNLSQHPGFDYWHSQ